MQIRSLVVLLFLLPAAGVLAQKASMFTETAIVLNVDSVAVKANEIVKPGTVTMIVLWNSMMRPAIAELDSLHKVYPLWKEKYGVEIIALAWEYPKRPENFKKFLARRSAWQFTIYRDPEINFGGALRATSMPATYFLDKEGKMVQKMTGFDAIDLPKYEEQLKGMTKN
ncbi:MAG: TlpA disulfide reductase family protein [Saprospiraceae bacterium]